MPRRQALLMVAAIALLVAVLDRPPRPGPRQLDARHEVTIIPGWLWFRLASNSGRRSDWAPATTRCSRCWHWSSSGDRDARTARQRGGVLGLARLAPSPAGPRQPRRPTPLGAVTDFIEVRYWPSDFNLADAAIRLGSSSSCSRCCWTGPGGLAALRLVQGGSADRSDDSRSRDGGQPVAGTPLQALDAAGGLVVFWDAEGRWQKDASPCPATDASRSWRRCLNLLEWTCTPRSRPPSTTAARRWPATCSTGRAAERCRGCHRWPARHHLGSVASIARSRGGVDRPARRARRAGDRAAQARSPPADQKASDNGAYVAASVS